MLKTLALVTLALGQVDWNVDKAHAIEAKKPLVLGVGCAAPPGPWLVSMSRAYDGDGTPRLIVTMPHKYSTGWSLAWVAELRPMATNLEVNYALIKWRREVAAEEPAPFDERQSPSSGKSSKGASHRRELPAADDDAATGRWEWTNADIPEYMERYDRAKNTQRIYNRGITDAVSRRNLEAKWQVPGGMVGIKGWQSALYKWAPIREGTFGRGQIDVLNSMGYFQPEIGWKRQYEDGAEFLDVLTNIDSGKVFEVRKAMKANGKWQRFVTYRNPDHWPTGYHGPAKLDCRGCHNEAGTGGYATGLVPGGDTVLSDPFPSLEGRVSINEEVRDETVLMSSGSDYSASFGGMGGRGMRGRR